MGSWCLEWASSSFGPLRRRVISGVDALETILDEIELCALYEAQTLQVDMWAVPTPSSGPLLVQFLVGDPRRGCLLWHDDGETLAAIDTSVPAPAHDIRYSRADGAHLMDACCAQLRPESVRQALVVYVLTRERPEASLSWRPAPAD